MAGPGVSHNVDLRPFARRIVEGGVVACATETGLALLANATCAKAVDRVFALKGRAESKTVALLAADAVLAARYVDLSHPVAARLAGRFWPGPLTLVAPGRADLPGGLCEDGLVGVRVPGSSPAAELARMCRVPLTATSANRSGVPPSSRWERVAGSLPVDAVVPVDAPGGAPSTVVRVTAGGVDVLRPGAVEVDVATLTYGEGDG